MNIEILDTTFDKVLNSKYIVAKISLVDGKYNRNFVYAIIGIQAKRNTDFRNSDRQSVA